MTRFLILLADNKIRFLTHYLRFIIRLVFQHITSDNMIRFLTQ